MASLHFSHSPEKKVTGHQEQEKKKKSIRETLTLLQTPPTGKKKERKKIAVDTGGAVIVSLHIVEKTHLLKGSREGLHSQTAKKCPQLL